MQTTFLIMLLSPLVGSFLNGLVLRPAKSKRAGVIATFFAAISFICAASLYVRVVHGDVTIVRWLWLALPELTLLWGFYFDSLTAVMALVVTGIGSLIHLYSIGYMNDDETPSRYFAYLNLFLFSMLVLLSADNLPVLFVGWEGVGLCSYLLIGYWYSDPVKAAAGMKAFIVNRIGDAGFLMGLFFLFRELNTLQFSEMAARLASGNGLSLPNLQLAAVFLFVGAMGKSAQIPLFVWLPDAMAGPTPVSALIHAATMVTAGVYLIARMNFLFMVTPDASLFVALIGGMTALFAATIATAQNDIKKVLAYSTVSQLGLMFLAVGTFNYVGGVFHLMTHAFFKALLFLGAGSVIHALHGEQDIRQMGGLRKHLPWTHWTFLIGTAAIAGVPPFAGFFSKDLILYGALGAPRHAFLLWALGSLTSLLTAFYMTRLYVLTFLGAYRGHAHPHESPPVMWIPLALLALGSASAGFVGMPHDLHVLPNFLEHFLGNVLHAAPEVHSFLSEVAAMALATGGAGIGIAVGWTLYRRGPLQGAWTAPFRPVIIVLSNKYWIDELYNLLFVRPFHVVSTVLFRWVDVRIVDAAVLLPTRLAKAGGTVLSFAQNGWVSFYLLVFSLGMLYLLVHLLKGWVL